MREKLNKKVNLKLISINPYPLKKEKKRGANSLFRVRLSIVTNMFLVCVFSVLSPKTSVTMTLLITRHTGPTAGE